jgi:hypothetical protein
LKSRVPLGCAIESSPVVERALIVNEREDEKENSQLAPENRQKNFFKIMR